MFNSSRRQSFISSIQMDQEVAQCESLADQINQNIPMRESSNRLSYPQCNQNKTTDEYSKKFEEYKQTFLKWSVTIWKDTNRLNDGRGRCNCPAFAKEYICKHVIGISIRLKYATAPLEAGHVPCGEKRKRGRPSKTK